MFVIKICLSSLATELDLFWTKKKFPKIDFSVSEDKSESKLEILEQFENVHTVFKILSIDHHIAHVFIHPRQSKIA